MISQAPELVAVVERLEELEQQNRRLKLMGVMVLILAGAGLLMGQVVPSSRTVEAEQFVLKDVSGKPRGILAIRADGTPRLEFLEEDGKPRAALATAADGSPSLSLLDRDGKVLWKVP